MSLVERREDLDEMERTSNNNVMAKADIPNNLFILPFALLGACASKTSYNFLVRFDDMPVLLFKADFLNYYLQCSFSSPVNPSIVVAPSQSQCRWHCQISALQLSSLQRHSQESRHNFC